jgi:hypothetical protein
MAIGSRAGKGEQLRLLLRVCRSGQLNLIDSYSSSTFIPTARKPLNFVNSTVRYTPVKICSGLSDLLEV